MKLDDLIPPEDPDAQIEALQELFPGQDLTEVFPDGIPQPDVDAVRELIGGRDLDDVSPSEIAYPDNDTILARIKDLTREVEAGDVARSRRAAWMRIAREADSGHWTQERLARAAGISQAAVAKALAKAPESAAAEDQPPYLAGRFIALAVVAGEQHRSPRGLRMAEKMLSSSYPITGHSILILKRLAEDDLKDRERRLAAEIRRRLQEIADAIELPPHALALTPDVHAQVFAGYHAERRALSPFRTGRAKSS